MDRLVIRGGIPLHGSIQISGAKNAALPLMAACLLTAEPVALTNVPRLADVATMARLLAQHGVAITFAPGAVTLRAEHIGNFTAPYELVRTMRASVLVLGPLLTRFGRARVSLPGGCAIGTRPIDLHLSALEQMGAEIVLQEGYIEARVPGRLRGAAIAFPTVSVGATENILMAATLAEGETVIANAAREPEIANLAHLLIAMGAKIEGIGTPTLRVTGVSQLHGASLAVIPDRIEAASYAAAIAITGGEGELIGADQATLGAVAEKCVEAGIVLTPTSRGLHVKRANGILEGVDIMTQPYPGFPTDMQAQMMALLSVARGASMVTETIFENRFMHVPELTRMGARITVHGASAMIRGAEELTGAEVMATDLRASICLVIAALAARGETVINRVYHLDRGYETLEAKLSGCGADITRLRAND